MWTLKSLSSVPSKTVRPTPTIPGRTSLRGISAVAAGKETVSRPASRPPQMTAAWIRNFMCLQGKGKLSPVIRSNWLQVKEKGAIVRSSA